MRQGLLERQMQGELDEANQVATPPTAMAIKEVLAGVDVERGMRFPVQGAQSHELQLIPGASSLPVALLQVLQQRNALFELLQIHIHSVEFLFRDSSCWSFGSWNSWEGIEEIAAPAAEDAAQPRGRRFSIQLWARVLAAPAIRVDPEVPHAHDAGERLEREP